MKILWVVDEGILYVDTFDGDYVMEIVDFILCENPIDGDLCDFEGFFML